MNVRLHGCLLFTGNCHVWFNWLAFFACTVKHMQRSGPIEVLSKVVARWGPVLVTLDAKGGLSVAIAGYCCKQQESESTWFNSGNLSLKEDRRCHPQLFDIFVGACWTTAKILGGIVSNIICFISTPTCGRFPILTNIFQVGRNHQLGFFHSSTVLVPWIQPPPKKSVKTADSRLQDLLCWGSADPIYIKLNKYPPWN